jgi:hypothetical protein
MAGRSAAYGLLGGLKAGAKFAFGAGGTLGLATKPAQKFMLGDYAFQQQLANALRKANPNDLQVLINQATAANAENQ